MSNRLISKISCDQLDEFAMSSKMLMVPGGGLEPPRF